MILIAEWGKCVQNVGKSYPFPLKEWSMWYSYLSQISTYDLHARHLLINICNASPHNFCFSLCCMVRVYEIIILGSEFTYSSKVAKWFTLSNYGSMLTTTVIFHICSLWVLTIYFLWRTVFYDAYVYCHSYSPNIKEIKVVSHRKVRRARLYYLRDKLPRLSTFKWNACYPHFVASSSKWSAEPGEVIAGP